jgi:hypothetical protein
MLFSLLRFETVAQVIVIKCNCLMHTLLQFNYLQRRTGALTTQHVRCPLLSSLHAAFQQFSCCTWLILVCLAELDICYASSAGAPSAAVVSEMHVPPASSTASDGIKINLDH